MEMHVCQLYKGRDKLNSVEVDYIGLTIFRIPYDNKI